MKKRFIPYPFQNNIHRLSKEDCINCFDGLKNKHPPKHGIKNFKDWLSSSFGEGLCQIFMYPYNFKVWAYPPEELNHKWVGERVAEVDLKKIKKNIEQNRDDVNWGPNNTFQFPKYGGTGAIWNSIANLVGKDKILLNQEVLKIDYKNKIIKTHSETIEYQNLLSTIALNHLTQLIQDEPLHKLSSQLKFSGTHVIGIGLEGQLPATLKGKCWIYFPEADSPFYRVTVFSNYSPHNVPDSKNQFSLMAEVSQSKLKPVCSDTIVEETIEAMKRCKLFKQEKILSKWHFHAEQGYPTPSLERDDILKSLLPKLAAKEIYSRGRFGSWLYEISNQDHTFMQGVEWVNKQLKDEDEKTFKF